MAINITYRFPAPQQGVAAPVPPAQAHDELEPPTEDTITKLDEMVAAYPGMLEKIGYHYAQQVFANMNKQGLVFGPAGSAFSGYVDLS